MEYFSHCSEIYFLASKLSTAITTASCFLKNFLLNILFVFSDTIFWEYWQLILLFIFLIEFTAHSAFNFNISLFLNKNCLLKFDFSILSWSATINFEFLFVDIPIIAKYFNNSHPTAPAPIKNIFKSSKFFWVFSPKIEIWWLYLDFLLGI